MRAQRFFVSAAAIALVAGPGLAMAQDGPDETPPVEAPPVTEAPPEDTPPVEAPPVETPDEVDGEDEGGELEAPDLLAEDVEEGDEVDTEDEGHGAVISALAACLPSGNELHGTGITKGFVMSQAASSGEVELDLAEGPVTFGVSTEIEIKTLCSAVAAMVESAEAPETAKGRPDWAGPKDDEGDTDEGSTDEGDANGTSVAPSGSDADEGDSDDDAAAPAERRGPPADAGPPAHAGKGKGKAGAGS